MFLQGWFRDVTREDIADVLPGFPNPLADPVYCIPPLGRLHHSPEDIDATPRLATTPVHSLSWQPQQALLKDRVSELKAQAATEVRGCTHIRSLPLVAEIGCSMVKQSAPSMRTVFLTCIGTAAPAGSCNTRNRVHNHRRRPQRGGHCEYLSWLTKQHG